MKPKLPSVLRTCMDLRPRTLALLGLVCVGLLVGLLFPYRLASAPLSPQQQVQAAWEQALEKSAYRYNATVVQTTWPTPRLENAGLSSQQTRFYLEGEVSRPQAALRMKLWNGAGRVGASENAVEIKVEGGRAYGRAAGEEDWRDLTAQGGNGFTDLFAPGSDPLAYLAAATDIRAGEAGEARIANQTQRYTRFAFKVDGPTFAAYMRDQVQARLEREGRWPVGMAMDVARQYVRMEGTGELWIGADGLPLRQVIHIQFPPQEGASEWVEADITSDFAQWDAGLPTFALLLSPLSLLPSLSSLLPFASCLLFFAGLFYLTWNRRSRPAYAAVVIVVLFSLLVTPLLQSQKVYALTEEQRAQADQQEAAQAERDAAREAQAALQRSDFAPHVSPLAQGRSSSVAAEDALTAPRGALAETPAAPVIGPDDADADGLSAAVEAVFNASNTATDTDNDGLDDYTEVARLGTDPANADSDGDELSDAQEVRGFTDANGQHWYTDPNAVDTNRDGRGDGQECTIMLLGGDVCNDLDGDGAPDVWDFDDDNDGVPDSRDKSPDSVMGGGRNPDGTVIPLPEGVLNFQLDQYEAGSPILVDFQARPQNPQHLWYTLNVLDWPTDDRAGQIQRVFTTTLGASGKDANGELKLIPMLEITIPYEEGSYSGLPVRAGAPATRPPLPLTTGDAYTDTARLNAWLDGWLDTEELSLVGVSVRVKDAEGTLLVYVPLSLVQDQVGDSPVAFGGQMLYRPTDDNFGMAHQIRLAWTLQMRHDICNTRAMSETFPHPEKEGETVKRTDANAVELWCQDTAHWSEQQGIVHTYYDDWYLTGLTVREDHGVTAGVVHEDPARYGGGAPAYENNLWMLAQGLDASFLAGRAGSAGKRDLTVDEIKRRFDRESNMGVSDAERWGIDAFALAVHTYDLPSQIHLGVIPMTHTKELLSAFSVPVSTTVTLLFVREERYRATGLLDGVDGVLTGNTLKMTLDPQRVKEDVLASVNWAPYRYMGAGVWEPYPLTDYWDGLDAQFKQLFRNDPALLRESDEQIAGRALLAKMFYLSLYKGGVSLVEHNGLATTGETFKSDELIEIEYDAADSISGAVKDAVEQIEDALEEDDAADQASAGAGEQDAEDGDASGGVIGAANWLSMGVSATAVILEQLGLINEEQAGALNIGAGALKAVGDLTDLLDIGTGGGLCLLTGVILGVGAFVFLEFVGVSGVVVQTVLTFVDIASQIIGIVKSVAEMMEAVDVVLKLQTLSQLVQAGQDVAKIVSVAQDAAKALADVIGKTTSWAAIIGLIISIGVAVALFVVQWATGALDWGLSFVEALDTMLATIAVAVFMFFLATIVPVGTIIVAIIGLIDSILSLICGSFNLEIEWLCAGISGALTKFFKWLLADNTPVVDLEAKGRFGISNMSQTLAEPDKGYIVGNRLNLQMDVTTALYRSEAGSLIGGTDYRHHYADSVIDDSTFRYYFTQSADDKRRMTFGEMESVWQPTGETAWLSRRFTTTQTVAGTAMTFTHAGLAATEPFYLAEAYAIKAQRCQLGGLLGCMVIDDVDVRPMDMSDSFVFDIFPATLDEFYTLVDRGDGGVALAWDATFPTQCDADGDGLRSRACGGPDPADGASDSDYDGLSDFWETQHAGEGYDPLQADGDGDGLGDYWEAFYETDPAQADSDYDGLDDGGEVFHFDDVNHDGIPDSWSGGWEYLYGFDANRQPLYTLVVSDPNEPDVDADGLTDGMEQVFGLSPYVPSEARPFTLQTRLDDPDDIVGPGQSLAYSAVLQNATDRFAQGVFALELPSTVQPLAPLPSSSLELQPVQTLTLTTAARIDPAAATQVVSLTARAGAAIVNRRGAAEGRSLWLRMDTNDYLDDSLAGNQITCVPTACPPVAANGYQGQAMPVQAAGPYLNVADRAGLRTNTFSIGLWVAPAAGALAGNWIQKAGAYSLYTDSDGAVHFTVGAGVTLNSTQKVVAGQWNHLFASYDNRTARLYLNGTLEASAAYIGAAASLSPVRIGQNCAGMLDEVELYPRALNEREVAAKFNTPLIALTFEEANITDILDCGGSCPTRPTDGPAGRYASFQHNRWYELAMRDSHNLNPRNGHFTYAAWILPHATPTEPADGWLALVGRQVPSDTLQVEYPTLYQQDNRLRVRFDAASPTGAVCDSGATGDILALDEWQHIAVAFNGAQFTFYVNGRPAARLAGVNCQTAKPAIPDFSELYIGRADDVSYLYIPGMQVVDEGDLAGNAEMRLFLSEYGDDPVWQQDDVDVTDWLTITETPYRFYGDNVQHWFDVCEDDSPLPCSTLVGHEFYNYDSQDVLQIKPASSKPDSTDIILHYRTYNEWFNGGLDEVRLYGYALSEADVSHLYLAQGRPLRLAADEPPGATRFANSGSAATVVACTGAACPTSGVPGRANQALRFDGVDDALSLATAEPLGLHDHSFTAAAWVKADTLTGERAIFSGGSLFLGLRDGQPVLRFAAGNELVGATTLETGRWYHLAWSYAKATQRMTLYVNGDVDATGDNHTAFKGQDAMTLGASFAGLLDEINLYDRDLTDDALLGLMLEAPAIVLHLDEMAGGAFSDSSYGHPATCADAATCPLPGAKGKVYGALAFDGVDDGLTQAMGDDAFLNGSFTVAAWVRGRDFTGERGVLAAQGAGANDRLGLSLVGGQPRFTLGAAAVLTGTAVVRPNAWTHLAARYDAELGEMTLFVNGRPNATLAVGDPGFDGAGTLRWGQGFGAQSGFFGALDEAVVYASALSDADLKALYTYQLAWYDTTFVQQVLVDADSPTAYVAAGAGYVRATDTVLAVVARDATSGIVKVEVRVDNGSWMPAVNDKGAWLFTFNADHTLSLGLHTVFARATDQAGNVGTPTPRPVFIDGEAPTAALATPGGTIFMPLPVYNVGFDAATNRWLLGLRGDASDDHGLAQLRVTLRDLDGITVGQAQFTPLSGKNAAWAVTYPFPYPPRGQYTLELTVSDLAGNTQALTQTATLRTDADPPWAEITQVSGATPNLLVGPTAVITGIVADIPYPPGALLTLHFEETAPDRFYDSSSRRYEVACTAPACPARVAGQYGQAIQLDGVDALSLDAAQGITTTFAEPRAALSALAWVRPTTLTGVQTFIATDFSAGSEGFSFGMRDGRLEFTTYDAGGAHVYSTTATLVAGRWQHVAAVWDAEDAAVLTLYVNGESVAVFRDPPLLPAAPADGLLLGAGLDGLLDDIFLHPRALTSEQVQDIGQPAARGVLMLELGFLHEKNRATPERIAWQTVWQAPLNQTTWPLALNWSYTVPDHVVHADGESEWLEGPYEVYLRATDAVGHQQVLPAVWSGEIDVAAPRITFQKYFEIENGASYLCDVQDYNLVDAGFVCAGDGPETFTPGYAQDDWYTALYSDTARLVRYSAPQGRRVSPPDDSATACDRYGQCTTAAPASVTCAQITLAQLNVTNVNDGWLDAKAELRLTADQTPVWERDQVVAGAMLDLNYTTRRCNANVEFVLYERDLLSDGRVFTLRVPSSASGTRTEPFNGAGVQGTLRWSAAQVTPTAGLRAPQQDAPEVWFFTPLQATTLTALTPLTLTGQVDAPDELSALTVTVNSSLLYTQTWSAPGVITAAWSAPWTPLSEGVYTFTAVVADRAGQTATASTAPTEPGFAPQPLTVFVDLSAPALAINDAQITQAAYVDGYARVGGWITDVTAIAGMSAQVNGGDWQEIPISALPLAPQSAPWEAALDLGVDVPDAGAWYGITVRATDVGGHVATTTRALWVDVTPPAPITLTVSYTNSQSSLTPLKSGATLRDVLSPTLILTWTPSASSDVAGYTVEWVRQTGQEETVVRAVEGAPGGPFNDSLAVGEAQQWRVRVTARDAVGNRMEQLFGPLYVDYALTPVYTEPFNSVARADLLYHDWTQELCNILGVDARRARKASALDTLHAVQTLYAAWAEDGLRLAWRGANWDYDGDLFIYLDTRAGGSWQAMNPYPATITNTALMLPLTWSRVGEDVISHTFTADVVLWVKDSRTAELWEWDGEAWQMTGAAVEYAFDDTVQPPLTELFVPLADIAFSGDPVGMVAFATEENALRTWAAMPSLNPVNSPTVVGTRLAEGVEKLLLTKQYTWDTLTSGVCPNGVAGGPKVQYTGADVQVAVNAEPLGLSYSIYRDHLYPLVDELLGVGSLAAWEAVDNGICPYYPDDPECQHASQTSVESDRDINAQEMLYKIMDTTTPAVRDGQRITYTLTFVNQGVGTAPGLEAYALTWGPLRLEGGTLVTRSVDGEYWEWDRLVFPMGDLTPGQTVTQTFSGWVDSTFDPNNNEGFGTIEVVAYDATGSEWDEIDWLFVDHAVDTNAPYAGIESGLPLLGPGSNRLMGYAYDDLSPVYTVTVETQSPGGGTSTRICPMLNDYEWACDWDLSAAQEGQQAFARARSHDAFGFTSDWTRWMTFTVDATAPALTLDAATQQALSDGLIGPNEMQFSGSVSDNRMADGVDVCDTAGCTAAQFALDETTLPQATFTYDDVPAVPLTITSHTCDLGQAHAIPFVVDEDFTIVDVNFGLNITHPYRDDVKAYLYSPAGTRALLIWWGSSAANYDVMLDDEATRGNYGDRLDQDTDAPYFDNVRWPSGFLGDFDGERSRGTWWLTLCDYYPDADTGTYNRSRLILRSAALPQTTSGAWSYRLPALAAPTDTLTQAITFYGVDSVGNHSLAAATAFTVDTIPPTVAVTTFSGTLMIGGNFLLSGHASDRHGIRAVRLNALDEEGVFHSDAVAMTGALWSYKDATLFETPGVYKLWIEAEDNAGNRRIIGPLTLAVAPTPPASPPTVYLPLVMRNAQPQPPAAAHSLYLPLVMRDAALTR